MPVRLLSRLRTVAALTAVGAASSKPWEPRLRPSSVGNHIAVTQTAYGRAADRHRRKNPLASRLGPHRRPSVVQPSGVRNHRTMLVMGDPRVVIVHDYATQRGGAERVAIDLLRAFPGSRLVTSCWNGATTYPEFDEFDVETLWLNDVTAVRRNPKVGFPLLARAFENHVIHDADVVICSSSGWSHRVTTNAPKIVYCHNPARWLYQSDEYFSRLPPWVRKSFVARTHALRTSDVQAAHAATQYLANSTAVARRVRHTYGLDATVVHPARGLSPDGPRVPVPGIEPGFLLTVSRSRGYKNTSYICDAVASLPGERLVVVGATDVNSAFGRIRGVSSLSDAQLRWLYANAAGLVAVGHEDFGLTPVEAQGFGIPSVTLRAGGYLDSTVEGVTGVFVEDLSVAGVVAGIRALRSRSWDAGRIRTSGQRFSKERFADTMHDVVDGALRRSRPIHARAMRFRAPIFDDALTA